MSTLLLLTGPAGAGKTTTARLWAQTRRHSAAHVCVDELRHFIKSGYASPKDGYDDQTHRQFEIARSNAAMLCAAYFDASIDCVVDDIILPDDCTVVDHAAWTAALRERPHQLIVLLPALDVVLERNRTRSDPTVINEEMVAAIHDLMAGWRSHPNAFVIDSTKMSPSEAARAIDALLDHPAVGPGEGFNNARLGIAHGMPG